MKVFEYLLLFLCATRQQIWTLHMASLYALSIFLHVMLHYARFIPAYLAQMFVLKEKDEEAWNFSIMAKFPQINLVHRTLP